MDNTARQLGLSPNGVYGTVRLLSTQSQGLPSVTDTDVDVAGEPFIDQQLDDKRVVVVSINAYRTGAREALSTLQLAGYSDKSVQLLVAAEIGFVNFSVLRDLTQVVNANFEERAQMDLTINVVKNFSEILYVIETVQFDNTSFNEQFEVSLNG